MKVLCIVILIPLLSFAGILWKDDFNSYNVNDDLDVSPNWDKINGSGNLTIVEQSPDDLWLIAKSGRSIYIATGGSQKNDMKVSLNEIEISAMSGTKYAGVITRFSSGKCYAAIKNEYGYFNPTGDLSIYLIEINNDSCTLTLLKSQHYYGTIHNISITASGNNPVYISAWFNKIQLTYIDDSYNLTGGYGGIYALDGYMYGTFFDDFVEETTTNTDIEPGSIGCIKALFK